MGKIKTDKARRAHESNGRAVERPIKLLRQKVVLLPPDEDGLIAVYAANLPGVASQGHTPEEALQNITHAFNAALSVYSDSGEPVPWTVKASKPEKGAEVRWVRVHG